MTGIWTAIDVVSWIALAGGALICIVGGVGLLRLPDFYCRTHGASITDTLGAGLILFGLILQSGHYMFKGDVWQPDAWIIAVKLLMIGLFIMFTSPTSGHALVKAAYADGLKWENPEDEEDAQ
ncbi:MAG: monovalent cation/H(+) antiporter subunit G [Myxococcota bacterium]|nr:monovalent cation/H(+) antiporter subunit G [Myxococcota bacterium]